MAAEAIAQAVTDLNAIAVNDETCSSLDLKSLDERALWSVAAGAN